MYFSTTLILLLVVVNILVSCLRKLQEKDYKGDHKPSSSLDKRPMHEKDHGEKNDSSSSLLKQRTMASSSSSSLLNPASVSQPWNHEVFLSFRGEDTRKTFVDHLYEALKQQGIKTYKDDETLARGETVRPALLKAIQESQIAVIVFSENYADSSWCLDELAHIIECKDKIKQIVIPIFYDVVPSDVRKQNGKYGEALTKHERENKQKADLWREALVKAGNISGLVPKDFLNGHEAQCIKSIVATISSRLSPLHTNVNKNLIGIETRLQDLRSMLKIGSGGVHMVGIWGVGGAGKTTLASAAYMEFSRQFEACCILENICEESSKHGLTKLQEKFLSLVTKTNEAIGSEMEGRSMIERKLRHKRVLVVLDDVNDRKQLEALAREYDWFGEGSRIIITTRDKHLLTLKNATICEVSLLSDDEALKLFSRHAFQKDEPLEDYKMLSQKVVSYANRLPLALEILGSSLYDQDQEVWKCTLAKLKCIPEAEVMERLKISFDGLKREEKELFLDISCFFRGYEIDEATMVLNACSFYPGTGVKVLVQKSLIKESNGKFEMHDLVEEMAHYIVRGEHPNDLEKHSRIWKVEDINILCAMGAAMSENEVLILRDNKSWNFESIYDKHPRFLDVIGIMKKLRCIECYKYPASSFPSNFQPINLGCLTLRRSKLKQLWEGKKILPNLKILDLGYSEYLMTTPDFNGLSCLERLNLEGCRSLEEIHPSIGYHERLVWVNMRECEKLKTFPPIRMKKLETLVLSKCKLLKKFPDIQKSMDSLVKLHLVGTSIELVPPSFGKLQCLKFLDLSNNKNLVELTDLPSSIATLIAECCDSLQNIGDLSNCKWLWKVSFDGCYKLTGVERVVHHMFQINAIEDHFMSIAFPCKDCSYPDDEKEWRAYRANGKLNLLASSSDNFEEIIEEHDLYGGSFNKMLRLPHNWYDDFSGFLLFGNSLTKNGRCYISIDNNNSYYDSPELDHWEKFDKNPDFLDKCGLVGYVPFASFRRPSWRSHITFSTFEVYNLRIGLVPRKSKSMETPIDYSESWKEKIDKRTFVVNNENQRFVIEWSPSNQSYLHLLENNF